MKDISTGTSAHQSLTTCQHRFPQVSAYITWCVLCLLAPSFHSNLACTCNPNPTDHSNHNKMVLEECPIHTLPAANTVKQPTIITYIDVQLLFIHKFATFMYLYSISALKNLILTTFLSHCENDLWLGYNLSGEYVKGEKVPV